ncbi:MAG: methylmalonyl-CoA carboxyltransferase [Acidimicrobiales bacterium]|nr:methylmalonyl-CoA carboxyltransferase [Acidimicrobiales bacterium]
MPPLPLLSVRSRMPGSTSAAVSELGGRRVVLVESQVDRHLGALRSTDGIRIEAAATLARRMRLPLVLVIASAGADVHEGVPALHGWGLAARAVVRCSGIVPVLVAVDGPAISGPALLLGLADHVVMTSAAYAYVSGPNMVAAFTGEQVSPDELGGAWTHARQAGTTVDVVADREEAFGLLANLLDYLPDHCDELPPQIATDDPSDRPTPEAGDLLPVGATGSYDMRKVAAAIVDDGALLELRGAWAPNLLTALASLDGRPGGIVANQPQAIAGTLDIPASQKGARFVAFCDAFNLPLVTLVDTPGFYPGKDLEWRGMIRHGAQLAFAYARATVPRLGVTLRKSYGGAYIVMDSRFMGNDLMLAWPSAEIAVMGARQAAEILMRRSSDEEREQFVADYEERLLNPYIAAARGTVDAVIDPAETRARLCSALSMFESKQERLQGRRHDNTPL